MKVYEFLAYIKMKSICVEDIKLDNQLQNNNLSIDSVDIIPVLSEKIIDCVNINITKECCQNNMIFKLQDLGIVYRARDIICIEDIWYSYDYIGLTNNPIKARIGEQDVYLYGNHGVIVDDGNDKYYAYIDYSGNVEFSACNCENKIEFIEPYLRIVVKNLVVNIKGTIGGEPFLGVYEYSGPIDNN